MTGPRHYLNTRPLTPYTNRPAAVERRVGSNVTTFLTPEDYKALEALAKKNDVSKSEMVRRAVKAYMEGDR